MAKKTAILGGGESGTGAALLAKKKGFDVFLSDRGKINTKYKKVLLQSDITFEEGKHTEDLILDADFIIKSPGIPDSASLIQKAQDAGIPVISEIEFASRYTKSKKICITGSNGKTTTTLLTYHILKNAGLDVGLGGNVGKSMAWLLSERDYDFLVLEISSFQLDGMFDFKAEIAVLMNITPDHLDRYDNDFEKYADSKFRIIRNQTAQDAFIFCHDDAVILRKLKNLTVVSHKYPFSLENMDYKNGAFFKIDNSNYKQSKLIININNEKMVMTLQEMALNGRHNAYNSMAAAIASRLLDIRKENIKLSMSDFQGVEHRLEYVASVRGIDFINDSKATNINSTWYALENANHPIIWICGGQDKGNDYASLLQLVTEKVKAIVCLGIDNTKIIETFSPVCNSIFETQSMADAVKIAYKLGQKGDTTLLSPACASFDLFDNYEDRGNQFKKAVINL
ncbi:MAG: UDP-N-acetylmuramoyl-L-alanine--D-glutamate ligase [Bacteroidales bacterium]|nr:UDP-N-acetylmuramoyl-L-alanine--D-glutamate ligase [Bacteroidales bacterium]